MNTDTRTRAIPEESAPNLWIAEDPTQPGTAFAVASTRHDQTETLTEWQAVYGVKGRQINREDALKMLEAWDKSKSNMELRDVHAARQAELAFRHIIAADRSNCCKQDPQ